MPISIELPKALSEYEFTYVGCVGTQDMNYHEHLEHRDLLNDAGINNKLLIFRGPHQWPPEEIVREAMLYLDIQANSRGGPAKGRRLAPGGTIARCHLRDPSWFQWPLLEAVIEGNIVADFPLCNKSFNCSYSGHDL